MIIGLVGFIGSGKGTVGDILCDNYGFVKVSFADALKDGVSALFGWPRHLLEGDTEESRIWRERPDKFWSEQTGRPITPRYMLQLLGTEGLRNLVHQDFWIIRLQAKLDQMYGRPYKNFVVSDVRFANELSFVTKNRGHILEIRRGVIPTWYKIAAMANRGDEIAMKEMTKLGIHDSEWKWIGYDLPVIENNGTLDSLKEKVGNFYREFENAERI